MDTFLQKLGARKPFILALTGYPDVGKDTVAQVLAPRHGFASIAFADALRREVSEAWRIDQRMLTHRPTKELPIPALAAGMCNVPGFMHWCVDSGESLVEPRSPRWALQRWATYQRRFNQSYYADIVDRWIRRQIGIGWKRIVVTDLRDQVEERVLRGLEAHVVRVHRPDARPLAADTAAHASEQHLRIKADADIVNDGSLETLAAATLQVVAELAGGAGVST
ncbi:hypothetical protein [Variovorax sp. YR216]|uniref:deoxynucleotide monophosphate kinase family protein n=1 Tax=Variovorax sp. YR216 TaxID=1882828 RepID=UPI0008990B9F|nr:hypothetical protein [Variovorax sp. YR216]SEA49752.1 hypothetical protein SAMN05444680_102657 [Variovorax sp. YR216]